MQRRVGKGQAHIANPEPDAHPGALGSDSEKVSRLNQRSFGVTNRIWLIVAVVLTVLASTHFILPSSPSSSSRQAFSTAHLKPKNYLNTSDIEPNPFTFCPVFGPGDELGQKYGALTMSQSRLHLGSGARVQKVITKALGGQPVTISVLGGSVSACHGAGDDPIASTCYPSHFFEWWNTMFPHPASELTNGAMRKTTSEYFSFCNAHHLPDVTDLVILEFDVDDSPDQETLENFELLVRSILIRPDEPAVVILGHFSPQVHHNSGYAGPDHWHDIVAQFYDVPHVSVKAALYPDYIANPSSIDRYFTDPVLASPAGHTLLADILISYFQAQICSAWAVASGFAYAAIPQSVLDAPSDARGLFGGAGPRPGPPEGAADGEVVENAQRRPVLDAVPPPVAKPTVPPARLNTRPGGRAFEEVAPFCVSANDLINPLPPSLFYGSGWFAVHPPADSGGLHYWHSSLPTSKLRIPIQVGAGDIGVYYMKEPLSVVDEGSAVECWVDDNYAGAVVIENSADVGEPTAALEVIDHFVGRGSHYVECQVLGEEGVPVTPFRIVGIFTT